MVRENAFILIALIGQSVCLFTITDRMVLLGSIQRRELVDLITRHVGHDKRLKIAAQRAAGAASE